MDEREQLQAILQQMSMGFGGRGRGRGGGLRSDMQNLVNAIGNEADDSAQAAGLTELCNTLNMATEDVLMAIRPDHFVGPILGCMRKEYNVELMLLATRALTYLIDSIPVTSQVLASKGGITVICDKLRNITDIELAEQALTALDKLARETPLAVLQAGGVSAMVAFIDFFSTSVQRRALASVAIVCKRCRSSNFGLVKDVLPQLQTMLLHEDNKIQEASFLALTRIIRGTVDRPEHVTLAFGDAAPAIIEVLENRNSDATFSSALQLVCAAVASSAQVGEMLIELGIVTSLLGILQHNFPQDDNADASFQLPPSTVSPSKNSPPEVTNVDGASPHSPKVLSSPLVTGGGQTPPSAAKKEVKKAISAEDLKEATAALVHLLPRAKDGYMPYLDGSKKRTMDAHGNGSPQMVSQSHSYNELAGVAGNATDGNDGPHPEDDDDEEDDEGDIIVDDEEEEDEEWEDATDSDEEHSEDDAEHIGEEPVHHDGDGDDESAMGHRESSAFSRGPSAMLEGEAPASAGNSPTKAKMCHREKMLQDSPYLLERIADALPTLVRMRLETEHPKIKSYSLEFVLRCVHFGDAEVLRVALADAPFCDFLRSALTEDLATQARALHICRNVINKLATVYIPSFMREGVTSALAGIKTRVPADHLPKELDEDALNAKTERGWQEVLAVTARDILHAFADDSQSGVSDELERIVSLLKDGAEWEAATDHLITLMMSEHGVSTFELVSSGVVAALVESLQHHAEPVEAIATFVSKCAVQQALHATDSSPNAGSAPPTLLIKLIRHLQSMIVQCENFVAPEVPDFNSINAQIRLHLIPHGTPEKEEADPSKRPARGGPGGAGGNNPLGREVSVSIEPLANIGAVAGFIAQRLLPKTEGAKNNSGPPQNDEEENDNDEAEDILPELERDESSSPKRKRKETPNVNAGAINPSDVHIRLGKHALPHMMPMTQVIQRYGNKDKKGKKKDSPLMRKGLPPQLMALFQGLSSEETLTLHYSATPFPPSIHPPVERTTDVLTHPKDPIKLANIPFQTSGAVSTIEAINGKFLTKDIPDMLAAPLRLLNIMYNVCGNWWSIVEWFRMRAMDTTRYVHDLGVHSGEFVSPKLTSKLMRHAANPLLAGQLSDTWCATMCLDMPFLFTAHARKFIFDVVFLGTARSLQRIQEHKIESGESQASQPRVHRVNRHKMRVWRKHAMECLSKVMDARGNSRDMFEFEYYGEEGSGLGPTLEFYTLAGEAIRQRVLNIWRLSGDEGSAELVSSPGGLFPKPGCPQNHFTTFGKFLARVLLDKRIPNLRLSKPLLKLLRGDTMCIDDLATISEGVYNTLSTVLVAHHKHTSIIPFNKPCDIHDLCLTFTVPGIVEEVELCSGGRDIGVDETNMDKYCKDVVSHTFDVTVRDAVVAMRAAFHEIIPLHALRVLTIDELSGLLGGHDQPITMAELEANTICDHGFSSSSPAVRNLFEVLVEMPIEDQRCFFQFLTGSPMLPVGGLKFLRPAFTVVRKTSSDGAKFEKQQLPSAMTCQNFLKLPAYDSKEQLKDKLYLAMREGAGAFNFT